MPRKPRPPIPAMRRETAQIVEDIEARPKEATETDIRMLVYLYRSQERTIEAQRNLIGELGRKNAAKRD
jgi:hypothetical protein